MKVTELKLKQELELKNLTKKAHFHTDSAYNNFVEHQQ